jgi:putative flippase GtrA
MFSLLTLTKLGAAILWGVAAAAILALGVTALSFIASITGLVVRYIVKKD